MAEHEPLVRRQLRRVLGRHTDEDDLVQEVFLRLTIRLRQLGPITIGAWLARVSRNVAIDELRRCRATPTEHGILDAVMSPVTDAGVLAVEGQALDSVLHHALQQLPERQRQALVQRLAPEGGRCAGEQMTQAARANLVTRARQHLRQELATRWELAAVPGFATVTRLWHHLPIRRAHRFPRSRNTPRGSVHRMRYSVRRAIRPVRQVLSLPAHHGSWWGLLATGTAGAGAVAVAAVVTTASLGPGVSAHGATPIRAVVAVTRHSSANVSQGAGQTTKSHHVSSGSVSVPDQSARPSKTGPPAERSGSTEIDGSTHRLDVVSGTVIPTVTTTATGFTGTDPTAIASTVRNVLVKTAPVADSGPTGTSRAAVTAVPSDALTSESAGLTQTDHVSLGSGFVSSMSPSSSVTRISTGDRSIAGTVDAPGGVAGKGSEVHVAVKNVPVTLSHSAALPLASADTSHL